MTEKEIRGIVEEKMAHRPKILKMFENCYSDTLENTVRLNDDGTVSGYLHMVAAIPEYRNLGLGHAMLSYSVSLAEERSVDACTLTTDDYRLPAIKNYLVGGFRPVIYPDPDSDMRMRWSDVAEKLGFADLNFIEE